LQTAVSILLLSDWLQSGAMRQTLRAKTTKTTALITAALALNGSIADAPAGSRTASGAAGAIEAIASAATTAAAAAAGMIVVIAVPNWHQQLKPIIARIAPGTSDQVNSAVKTVGELTWALERSNRVEGAAYETARDLAKLGFAFSPFNVSSSEIEPTEAEYTLKVMIPVTKGLEFVVVVVGSRTISQLRAHLYNEEGNDISSDLKRTEGTYTVRPTYTGTMELFVVASRVRTRSTVVCLIGRRGLEEGSTEAEPRTLGWEPTFRMGGSPTPAPQEPAATPPTRPSPRP
jgi:hypothetical protein